MSPVRSLSVIAAAAVGGALAGLVFGYLLDRGCPSFVETALRRPGSAWSSWEVALGYGACYGTLLGTLSGWVAVVAEALGSSRGLRLQDE